MLCVLIAGVATSGPIPMHRARNNIYLHTYVCVRVHTSVSVLIFIYIKTFEFTLILPIPTQHYSVYPILPTFHICNFMRNLASIRAVLASRATWDMLLSRCPNPQLCNIHGNTCSPTPHRWLRHLKAQFQIKKNGKEKRPGRKLGSFNLNPSPPYIPGITVLYFQSMRLF